jgi:hypothetical protein
MPSSCLYYTDWFLLGKCQFFLPAVLRIVQLPAVDLSLGFLIFVLCMSAAEQISPAEIFYTALVLCLDVRPIASSAPICF